jgi:hypothetical protein
MSFTVYIRVLGIPVEAAGNILPAEPSVGLMSEGLEDITLHNVKNGSRLKWLEAKVETLDKWNEVAEAIWAELEKHRSNSEPADY